jgi:DNA-binding protein YbaB
VSTEPTTFVEVRFELVLDFDTVPPTYQDPEYLQEVLQEAIKDAVYDIGAEQVNEFFIELVSEE